MVLVVSNSKDVTVDFLCQKMTSAQVDFVRFDSDFKLGEVAVKYTESIFELSIRNHKLKPSDVSHVWLRRPKPLNLQIGKDSAEQENANLEWGGAVENFFSHIPTSKWINHPSHNAQASQKIEQLSRAKKFGLNTPETLVTQSAKDLVDFFQLHDRQVIVKPLVSGFLERENFDQSTQIYTNRISEEQVETAILTLPLCPSLFQRAITQATDVRITIIDGFVTCPHDLVHVISD